MNTLSKPTLVYYSKMGSLTRYFNRVSHILLVSSFFTIDLSLYFLSVQLEDLMSLIRVMAIETASMTRAILMGW